MREIASDEAISFNRVKQILQAIYRVMNARDHIELVFEVGRHWKEIEKEQHEDSDNCLAVHSGARTR